MKDVYIRLWLICLYSMQLTVQYLSKEKQILDIKIGSFGLFCRLIYEKDACQSRKLVANCFNDHLIIPVIFQTFASSS